MQRELILLAFFFFLYGIIIGSFVNVCIYRIPKHENIAVTRSHCMSCGHQLAWYDLFPLFSYLFLRGKCRYCGVKLSKQYPLVEFINGVGYVWIFGVCGIGSTCIFYCLTFSALVALSVIDWRTFEIPVGINLFIGAMGIGETIFDCLNNQDQLKEALADHLIGMICVSLFLYLLYVLTKGRGIGGGDVKLMAAAGLLLGWQKIILALVLGCVIGSIVHIVRMKLSGQKHVLAFGPYLSVGIFITMLYGQNMIDWYLGLFAPVQ